MQTLTDWTSVAPQALVRPARPTPACLSRARWPDLVATPMKSRDEYAKFKRLRFLNLPTLSGDFGPRLPEADSSDHQPSEAICSPLAGQHADPRAVPADDMRSVQAMLALLQRIEGASLAELAQAAGWSHRRVAGFLTQWSHPATGVIVSTGHCPGGRRYRLLPASVR